MSATMTLIGLYNYQDDLFDDLSLPDGIDKQTFIENLLLRSGEFQLLYPDGDFMKSAIVAWGRKWFPTFTRWVSALAIEYDPLENYDRREEWQDTVNAKTTGSSSGSTSGSASGSTGGTTGSTTTNSVSAYDGGTAYTPKDQTVLSGTDSSTSSSTSSSTNSSSNSSQENRGAKHEGRTHGNIGVTTSQQMLISELDLGYWNLYERMIGLFLTEFVLPIY